MTNIAATTFRDTSAEEWDTLVAEGKTKYLREAGGAILKLLESQRGDPVLRWGVNNYQHSLQCATRAVQAGESEEYVVAALLHDVGQDIDPYRHDKIAAAMLQAFLSPELHWIVEHHQVFQLHFRTHSKFNLQACEQFRGHPYFESALRFCEYYDQNCFDPNFQSMPLSAFEPMVRRTFARVMEERVAA
jgi:predicted HD phosphohydrolase